jgi:isoleucyl-tRNA synthetase
MAPIAPFYAEHLFRDLNNITGKDSNTSVHLSDFPIYHPEQSDVLLEERMKIAQDVSSMVLALRKKSNNRVRQPLQKIMIPILEDSLKDNIEAVAELIKSEVNVKEIVFITNEDNVIVKKAKPDFKKLGPKYPKQMKAIQSIVLGWGAKEISDLELNCSSIFMADGVEVNLLLEDVELITEDIPGWLVASQGKLTVALDVTITDDLKKEGLARELVNRIQNVRKAHGLEVTDQISVVIEQNDNITETLHQFNNYICNEILAKDISVVNNLTNEGEEIDLEEFKLNIKIHKN